ncbi:hypothetical protein BK784_35570 [Bacillus thuringiensis serovar medellin]|uniref:Uncharacterized protein n=1 Tax=Bacillus thuringiensis subsp. medellin TaxID=79672 RepID=A0A9X6MMU1_BACTV|nr:hypothetical protein [Bacillus thuringiensis]OUB84501.1 hypothetical protein BK784_35570 [Bacillus thuringiensis serovar medellin]
MYFTKLPVNIFDNCKNPEEIYFILCLFFNKTINPTFLENEKISPQIMEYMELTEKIAFCIPSPAFIEEQMGVISPIDLVIYTYLCKNAFLNGSGKTQINIKTIHQETYIKKTLIRSSINTLDRTGLIIKDSQDGYYIIEELLHYFTDNEFKQLVNSLNQQLKYSKRS